VLSASGKLAGIFTQGDFVRAYQQQSDVANQPVAQFMSRKPITIHEGQLAAHLLQLLEKHNVDEVIVVNDAHEPVGVVDTQDLSRVKIL
jgi:arabinose-5-phosphate isomerase